MSLSNTETKIQDEDIKAYQIIRGEIQYEYSAMSNRVTWLITTQAFLFTAYAIAVPGESASSSLKDSLFHPTIPILGSAICIILYSSIYASINRIKLWHNQQTKLRDKLEGWHGLQSKAPTATFLGLVSPVLLPALFLYIWLHFLGFNSIFSVVSILVLILLVLSVFVTFAKR